MELQGVKPTRSMDNELEHSQQHVSTYLDDLALACAGQNKEAEVQQQQREIDKVIEWSEDRLTHNAAKRKTAFSV